MELLAWRRLRGNLITVYKYLKCRSEGDGARVFSAVCGDITKSNRHKLKNRRFCVNMESVKSLGDTQKTPEHGVLGYLCLSRGWVRQTQKFLSISATL